MVSQNGLIRLAVLAAVFTFILLPIMQANVIIGSVFSDSVVKGQQSSFSIFITNNETFSIHKVAVSPVQDYAFPVLEEIPAGSSQAFVYNITASFTGNRTSSATLSWSNKTQGISNPTTTEIIINSTIILPNNATIRKFDSIAWRNTHSSNLTVKATDSEYEIIISPGNSVSRVFSFETTKGFYVAETGFIGNITVASNVVDVYVHDSTKDIPIAFVTSSILTPSSLTASSLIANFSMAYNETQEGVLLLSASGFVSNATIEASKWIVFSSNNFSFSGQKLVSFKIQPVINKTSDTGAYHNITFKVRSENTPEAFANISVLISLYNFSIDEKVVNQTQVVLATREQLVAFCRQYPEECPKQNVTQFVFINRTDTEDTITLQQIRDELERVKNIQREQSAPVIELSTKVDTLSSEVSRSTSTISSLQQEKEQEKKRSLVKTILIVVLSILGLGAASVLMFGSIIRKKLIERRIA